MTTIPFVLYCYLLSTCLSLCFIKLFINVSEVQTHLPTDFYTILDEVLMAIYIERSESQRRTLITLPLFFADGKTIIYV